MNGLDLFSGIGGISIALEPWVRTVAYCEQDRYAQGVLFSRMQSGDIHRAPIWDDVTTLQSRVLGTIDIITGGFPCQDISCAGNGAGLEGKRSGLFFEIVRLVGELRPKFVFLENVPAITVRGLDRVLLEFTAIGYDCRWTIVSAAELGAPHLRERWFLLAHTNSERIRNTEKRESETAPVSFNHGTPESLANSARQRCREKGKFRYLQSEEWTAGGGEEMAYANGEGLERCRREESSELGSAKGGWWSVEPDVGRMANGVPKATHRIKCLGNAVVPEQAREAFMRLMGLK